MKSLITLLLTIISWHSYAQSITGKVSDNKRNPLTGAVVHILQNGQNKEILVTDPGGNFSSPQLIPGIYSILVVSKGFDTLHVKSISVQAGKTITRNFRLTNHSKQKSESETIRQNKKPLISGNNHGSMASKKDAAGASYLSPGGYAAPPPPLMERRPRVQYLDPSIETYKKNPENDFMNVKTSPLSTISVDVDRASYSNVRRFLNDGQKPPADAVRIEEMINYFDYDYAQPKGEDPIAIHTELTNCPWQEGHKLLHVGIQAIKINTDKLPPSNMVFLIDVSGSMESAERLPLLVAGLKLLVNNLRAIDKVTIVTYAGNAGLVLPPTKGSDKQTILDALDKLEAGGSTAGGEGIKLAYAKARENFIKGGNNRVLLATDGDFNVGISNDNDLEDLITKERESGVYLTCLGFGKGNFKDSKMEVLANKGNGNYDYIDNIQEAQKTLVTEFGGTLFTVAKDVKAQIEFNPEKVQGYRLIGYEDRLLNTEDFKDDKKDAGDMGSGHIVTIMYEIIPVGVKSTWMRETNDLKYQQPATTNAGMSNELATIKFRYKKPDGNKSAEMVHTIADKTITMKDATENSRFSTSVAMFGMLLKDSKYKGTDNYAQVISLAEGSHTFDKEGYRSEFIRLAKAAKELKTETTLK